MRLINLLGDWYRSIVQVTRRNSLDTGIELCAVVLIMLFVYTPVSKWFEFEYFKGAIQAQPLPEFAKPLIVVLLPPVELLVAVLLVVPRAKLVGFVSSFILMAMFTVYTGLIAANYFHKQPCSCGGVFQYLTWKEHLELNVLLLFVSMLGGWLCLKKRTAARNQGFETFHIA